jgi:SAM-dependent methyltransferase
MLRQGRRGLGFAVGTEPLTSLFASRGVTVLATDLAPDRSAQDWVSSGQQALSAESLFNESLIARDVFDDRVSFRHADMRALDYDHGVGQFDFLWSACAFEHLGSLETGLQFVANSTRFLKPGGLAVHTTEYNVSSNEETLTEGVAVIYRRRDIEELDRQLRKQACGLESVDFDPGFHLYDLNYDRPPYYSGNQKHVKLEIGGFICTSILLIVHKG